MGQKHTPGPWRIGDAGQTVYGAKAEGEFPKVVADTSKSMTVGERRANARLIAAAPELLEALRDLQAQCQKWAPTIDQSRARAAIAKAEGA